ncbi:hypothetical protein A1O3_09742 [Capronia epimyces CBS 606.96]|uniref:Nucleoside phosphorylase domain-containing protein n=1 Tax=Capronia epimyces CBS 606.96 TaxID=1182542 RepID=W9XJJ1_9EURO|nr:uncharacterized protein A1O3_09742 [Capronia epimyces CBS 606.96]EXJ77515.1 hypothetical protein A1O3_09742 [Capronia epimyces CBS 606.96]
MAPQRNDDTVGWICSLPIGFKAARSMMDKVHPELPRITGDTNTYAWGNVAGHNVVIATGVPSHVAAVAAANLIRSFPGVRFCLLVGIGGGVPDSSPDIRLGDVVFLQAAARRMATMYKFMNFRHHIKKAVLHLPDHELWCSFPGREQDLLFSPEYEHQGDECTSCDHSRLIKRVPRVSTAPVTHHGFIASGDTLVRDTYMRDRLHSDLGVICFETEATGLMNDFPCIVIKGITDYSDSHTNNRWHGYAVLSAAAYAKQLLVCTSFADVRQSSGAADVLRLDTDTSSSMKPTLETSAVFSEGISALMGWLEPEHVDATANFVRIFASHRRLKPLYSVAGLRMTLSVFQCNVTPALAGLSQGIRNGAQTPLELAIAWMLRRYKATIAAQIYNWFQPTDGSVTVPSVPLDENPASQLHQLKRFINERVPEPRPAFNRKENSQAQDVDPELPNTENDVDEPLQEQEAGPKEAKPYLAALGDVSQVHRILCEGEAFDEMFKQLEKSLTPTPIELIHKVLRRHIPGDPQPKSINCVLNWQLLEYCDNENITVHDIDAVFTLTGTFQRARAERLGDYIHRTWKTGKVLLDGIKHSLVHYLRRDDNEPETEIIADEGLRIRVRLLPKTADAKEQALVALSGTFHQIAEILGQLAWLAATLRPHAEGQLTVSEIDFQDHQIEIGDSIEPVFRVSLYSQDKVRQPNCDERGSCWTSLFTESVLAYGCSPGDPDRPEGLLGLELPFEIMLRFTGAKYPVWLGQRLALASESGILIPQVTFGDSIQWHFQKMENSINQAISVNIPDSQLEALDLQKLVKSQGFLGYSRSSEVLLGTADFAEVEILKSDVPHTRSSVEMKLEGPVNMGPNKIITGNLGSTWKFNRGESALLEAKILSPDERLRRAARASALLYDDGACIAYLVSELSIILQIVSMYIRKDSRLENSKIPRADRSADGGAAAKQAIESAQDLIVPFATGARKYLDIVESFLDIIEQRKIQRLVNIQQYGRISLKRGLRGWDFADIQSKTLVSSERELPAPRWHSRPIWWKLFKSAECFVLFARVTRPPIRCCNTATQGFLCCAWEQISTGGHLLLANMHQLDQLRGEFMVAPMQFKIVRR